MKYLLSLLTVLGIASVTVHAHVAMGGLDAGGGQSQTPHYRNHGSVGGIGGTGVAGGFVVRGGLLEILYPQVPLDGDEDSDGNGLPDDWELEHFGYIGVDPNADADGDGTSNLMEWLAGTDPNDATSVFRPDVHRDGDALVLTVPTREGRVYRIWGSGDLGEWDLLDSVDGDGTEMAWSYPLDGTEALPYFLRMEIVLP